ncbi:MAG: hypothetical protein IMX00_01155 [Limnochordales bacterium]|nr:hypothetical protein [Limnochordales bacterium]
MPRCRHVLLATVVLLVSVSALLGTPVRAGAQEAATLVPIGRDYLAQRDVSGPGELYVAGDGSIWVKASRKPYLLQYRLDGGFVKAHFFEGLMVSGKDQAFFLETEPSQAVGDLPGFSLYAVDSERGLVLDRAITLPELRLHYLTTLAAINSQRLFLVQVDYETDDEGVTGGTIRIGWSALGSTLTGSASIPAGERIFGVYGCVADDANLYVLLWADSGRYVYNIAADSLTLQSKCQIPSHLLLNPSRLILTARGLYVVGDDRALRFRVGRDGRLVLVEGTDFSGTGLKAYFGSVFPYRQGFVVLGTYKGAEGLYFYDSRRSHVETIYKPVLPADALERPWGIAAYGRRVLVASGRSLKVFANGLLRSQISGLPEGVCRLAVNGDGIIAATSNSSELVIIRKGRVERFAYPSHPLFLFGIAAAPDGTFVIRPRGGPGRSVVRFDPATNTFTELFELPVTHVHSDEIAVLPDGNLVVNWTDNQLRILSPAGELLVEGPQYLYTIAALSYSPFHKALVALARPSFASANGVRLTSSSEKSAILLIDPESLEISRAIHLPTDEQLIGLAISPKGRICVSSVTNTVYEIAVDTEIAEQEE